MKEVLCRLIWKCPKCGKKHKSMHWPEGEELKIIFSCPNKGKSISSDAINFICGECGWKFRVWIEKEEVKY